MPQKDLEHRINQIRDKMASGEISADYELRLEQHYRQWLKEGDTVLDVGAHIGRHLAPFLDCVGSTGQVLAFEPLPYAFKILKEKFTDTRAVLHNVALGTVAGLADFMHAQARQKKVASSNGFTTPRSVQIRFASWSMSKHWTRIPKTWPLSISSKLIQRAGKSAACRADKRHWLAFAR